MNSLNGIVVPVVTVASVGTQQHCLPTTHRKVDKIVGLSFADTLKSLESYPGEFKPYTAPRNK